MEDLMVAKQIVTDEAQLGERCDEIDVRKDNKLVQEIVLALKGTINEHKDKCLGLAANQIGYNKRIFCINFNGDVRTFINPMISEVKGFELSREGCMSFPDKEYIRPRHNQITVMYQTPLGKTECRKLLGKAAIVFQHELDHLDGLTIADIGLEITPEFDNADEQEKEQVIKMYLDSLDLKQKDIDNEIENNEHLKQTRDAINFMTDVATGKVQLEKYEKENKTEE